MKLSLRPFKYDLSKMRAFLWPISTGGQNFKYKVVETMVVGTAVPSRIVGTTVQTIVFLTVVPINFVGTVVSTWLSLSSTIILFDVKTSIAKYFSVA